jgi:hypothetical protein
MTDTRAYDHLADRLARGRRRFLSRTALAGLARFAGASLVLVFALLVVGVLFERTAEAPIVLAALALGGLVTFAGLFVVRPLLAAPPLKTYALWAEERFPEGKALFVNTLELVPATVASAGARAGSPYSSSDLVAALAAEASRRVDAVDLDALAPRTLPRAAAWLLAAGVALWGAGFALFPGPLGGALDRLFHPRAAAASIVQITLEPGDVTIPPGATLHVRATVLGTNRRPTLVFARAGKNERFAMERADGAGAGVGAGADGARYEGAVRGVSAPGVYWVEAAGVRSRFYDVSLSGQAGVVSFDFTYRYPAYTKLSGETQSATRGDVTALQGTDVEVIVNLDRQAESVSWVVSGEAKPVVLESLTPRRFKGAMKVTRDGSYALEVKAGKETIRESYRIQAVPDQAPLLTVIEPEGDLDLPAGGRVPIWAAVSDDYGLGSLSLVWQKGEKGVAHRMGLAHWPDHPREASASTDWDAGALALLPGESATFHLELTDNDAFGGPNVTKSRDFTIRFPLLSELYEELGDQRDDTQHALEQTMKEAKELSKQVEELARSLQNDRNLTWEKKQAAKEALEKQQKLAQEIEKQAQSLDQQAQTAEEHQAFDEQVLAKMKELSEVVNQIKNEELKQAMEDLARRMDQSDPRQLQDQLKDLQQAQKEMLASLERSIELMKKIRQEEKAHEAAERAKELAQRQDELNKQMGEQAPKTNEEAQRLAEEQKKLQDAADKLAQDLQKLAQEMKPQDGDAKTPNEMEKGAQQIEKQVTPPMEQSQKSLSKSAQNQSEQKQAKQSGQKAKQELDQLADQLDQAADGMSQEQDGAVAEAIRRSAQDLVNLSQAGEGSLKQPGANSERAERQQDLKEGAQRVVEDLIETGKNTPYLGPKAVKELGRAINSLEKSRDAYSQGNPTQGKQQGESAVDALDQAVLALREAEQACNKPGNNPNGQQGQQGARQKMQGLSQQQGELNQETRSLAERLTQQQRLAAGDQNTVERLAAQQRAIREGLAQAAKDAERSNPENRLLGRMEKTAEEMKQVEEKIRAGDLDDETLEQQQKILSRMLDAQRSLHRRDFEEKRESNTGRDIARSSPAELRADLLKREDRARYDLLRAQAEKYPSEYRALVEAYLRRLGSSE